MLWDKAEDDWVVTWVTTFEELSFGKYGDMSHGLHR